MDRCGSAAAPQLARRVNAAATPAIINSDPPVRIATFITAGRRMFDPIGHYARPDVLDLIVRR